VYFVTQNPLDIPESVLGQLGNRVQHALRAFTPRDQKAVRTAAETLRPNPKLDTVQVITELSVGEALVSFLDEKGRPGMVERAHVVPPASRIGPLNDAERAVVMKNSLVAGHYEQLVDRESAYEKLKGRTAGKQDAAAQGPATNNTSGNAWGNTAGNSSGQPGAPQPDQGGSLLGNLGGALGSILTGSTGPRGGHREGALEMVAKSAARAIGSQVGREIIRGVLGSILGGGSRRR
jgi:DNA helicase HerA-like ATPase